MKNYTKEITVGLLFATLVGGFIFWFIKHESASILQIGILTITIILGVYVFVREIRNKRRNLKDGSPSEDEFTNLAKLYAGSRAFLGSIYLWFLIFIFQASFSDREEMLGIGILGSSLIYGICLWYYKSTASFHEK
jgi:hypothetical protein